MTKGFHYGGQAVIEGVMIRGQKSAATAVRRPGGMIAVNIQPLSALYTGWFRKAPLLRGIIVLIEAMAIGMNSLLYSANASLEEEGEKISGVFVWLLIAGSLALAVFLFFIIPLFLTRLINPYIKSSLLFNLVEGLVRLAIFLGYLKLMALMPDIRRVFAYHGAEHKTVNAYEAGVPMEVEAVKRYSTAHVRCGTSFLFVVLIIAIMVFTVVGRPSLEIMVLSRIILIPVIASLGYEVIFFGANHAGNALVRAIMAPGLWLQSLTTREPDESQIEVAISAMKKVIEIDQPEEATQVA